MQDYILNQKPEPASNGTAWAFDLGKGSIGEAVRDLATSNFPHHESLLIPPDLARRGPAALSGTPANKWRAFKTREAHYSREEWLETVWVAAGLDVLKHREVWENPKAGKWELKNKGDYRLEREFAPQAGETTKDGAPSDTAGAKTLYTSCLLRIQLLQEIHGLAEWQIYKALHSAIQTRGYGRVPWATKEAQKQGKTAEEIELEEEKKLQQADEKYRLAVGRWPAFKRSVPAAFHFPCYYDAQKMGFWNLDKPDQIVNRHNHLAESTAGVRFDRADVRAEIIRLGDSAAKLLPKLHSAFTRWQNDGWKFKHPATKEEFTYPIYAKTFGEFLCDGPTGCPDESSFEAFLAQRADAKIRRGTFEEWMAALGQKTPRFENRILNDCVLIPRFHVCKAEVRLEFDKAGKPTGKLLPESLLASEVTFLLKLKNLLVADGEKGQRKLTAEEIKSVFAYAQSQLHKLELITDQGQLTKNWPGKVADCFSISKSEWVKKAALGDLELRPLPGHEEVKAPKTSGRSAYSRVALRIIKELILSGESPLTIHARLIKCDPKLLQKLGSSSDKPLALLDDSTAKNDAERKRQDTENRKKGLLVSELNFLKQMRKDEAKADSWENIFIPSQTLDALQQRHTDNGKLDADAAIRELLGTINDPIVRHRLGVFAERLKKLQLGDEKEKIPAFGVPKAIVLEFVREDFMGEQAKRDYQKFLNDREKERKTAKAEAGKLGMESRSSGLRFELFKAQGGICLYTGKALAQTHLEDYEIDHIVPRSLGGPDAAVNYVLTFHDVNNTKEKGKLTPFALLHGKDGWDSYLARVKKCATVLRNKKVQLLTREDAPELVQRYTALAETAWVSKLAQTIVNLRFGWTNGNDSEGRKRVIIVSGGLTARVRRKYSLDKLLYTDATDPEVLAKKVKNREDKRHHALDAMTLTFIPQWARDPGKEGFFRFPAEFRDATGREDYERIRALFRAHLDKTTPRYIAFERPHLADTIYAKRDGGTKVVKRELLRELAYKQEKMKPVFNLEYAASQIEAIRDEWIKKELRREIAKQPSKEKWEQFCANFRQIRKDGSMGARIIKVAQNRDEDPEELADLSKDGCGAWRMRDKEHQGQFVYLDGKGRPRVRAVRVFESAKAVKGEIQAQEEAVQVIGFFQSMCQIELDKPVVHGKVTLQPGKYLLNTIKKDGRAQLTSASGIKSPEIGLAKLLPAGFKRI